MASPTSGRPVDPADRARPVTILDGGMGKELRRIGAPFRQPEWSSLALMEAPDRVVEAHRNFIEAGADVVTTNNYAVVPYHHPPGFFAERGAELTTLAGRLARQAAEQGRPDDPSRRGPVLVAGSMPPLFGSYEPNRFDAEAARPLYREIATALAPYVDIWLGETLSTISEMLTIVDAIRDVEATARGTGGRGETSGGGTGESSGMRPIWIAFTVPEPTTTEVGAPPITLHSGETLEHVVAAAAELVERGVRLDALLVNCSTPERTGAALRTIAESTRRRGVELRLGGYANAFPVAREDDYAANAVIFERRDELTADRYASIVGEWIDGGATIAGGCCDMYPEHIAELAHRFGAGSIRTPSMVTTRSRSDS